jgi:pilus assembly protein CpaB
MRRRLVMVLVLSSAIGLVASVFVYRVVIQAMASTQPQPGDAIVIAAVNIGLAETITSQHVKLVAWPKASVPTGALRSVADAEGRVVRGSIVAGEPLLEAKLAPQLSGRGGIMPMLVPEGQRGVTIKVDDAIKESGFVLPNSHVDVVVSMPRQPGSQERVAKVILQDVPVLAAGQTVEMRDNKPVTVTTVTLSLTPEQAERLALAQTEGRLTLTTRNLRDNRVVATRGVTAASLLGADSAAPATSAVKAPPPARRRAPTQTASTPLPTPKIENFTISVLRGGKLSEQLFVRSDDQLWIEQKKERP